jgi:penicillin-binding protein A
MDDFTSSIKKVLFVFLLCFIVLISYLSYFVLFEGPRIVNNPMNRRSWAKRNEVLRGTIYDRNMKALTRSERGDLLTQKREYLGGEVYAHVLGYVDQRYGITGLEFNYDHELMAARTRTFLDNFRDREERAEKVGNGVKITIDDAAQKAAFKLLGNNRGAVVAIDPKTGEILAMVSKPSYNPNKLSEIWQDIVNDSERRPLLNRAVSGMYPPGSTFKAVTAISGLDNISGLKNRAFEDQGKLVFNDGYSLRNYNGTVMGNIRLKEAFSRSSNVYFGSLAIELGPDALFRTSERFHFNKNIPADGIIIDNSRFPKQKSYEPGSVAQSGIGQSDILATPIQMALVASAIANDGIMMKPRLVTEILSPDGAVIRRQRPSVVTMVTSKEHAGLVKEYMREVVVSGTGKAAAVQGITVSGKTGTSEHLASGTRPPHSWFIGFAPYDDPKIALAVIVEEGGTGGGAAAKVASGVFKAYLNN